MQISVQNSLSSKNKLKPLWLFVLSSAERCVFGGGSRWQKRCEVLWLLVAWRCTLPPRGDFSLRKMRDFSLLISTSRAVVASIWCLLCWLEAPCPACQAALALGRVPLAVVSCPDFFQHFCVFGLSARIGESLPEGMLSPRCEGGASRQISRSIIP